MTVSVLLCRDVIINCVLWSYFSAVFLVKHKQTHMRFALKKMNKQLMLHRNQVQCKHYESPNFNANGAFDENMFFSEKWMEEREVHTVTDLW